MAELFSINGKIKLETKEALKSIKQLGRESDKFKDKTIDIKLQSKGISDIKSDIKKLGKDKNIDIKVDTGKAEAKTDSLFKKLKKIDNENIDVDIDAKGEKGLKGLLNSMKKVGKETDNTKKDFNELGDEVEETTRDSSKKVNKFADVFKKIGSSIGGFIKTAGGKIIDLTKMAGSKIIDFAKVAGSKLKDVGVKIGDTTKKVMGGIAKAGIAAGAAIAGIATASVKVATDIKKSTNGMQASLGATTEETKKLEAAMKGVYANNFGDNFEEIGETMSKALQTIPGLLKGSQEEIQKTTEDMYALSDTFKIDPTESARSIKALMDNFGMTAGEATDMIAKGFQDGLNYSDEFVDSLNEYSIYYAKMGLSSDQMFAQFKKGAESGAWNLDKIGDATKELGIRLQDGSDTTAEALQAIGLNSGAIMEGIARGGETAEKAYRDVNIALMKMGKDSSKSMELQAAGVALYGTMWEDLSKDVIFNMSDIEDATYNAAGTMEKIKKIKYDDIGSSLEGLKRQFTLIGADIGEKLLPYMNNFINFIKDNMPAIKKVIGDVVNFIGDKIEIFAGYLSEHKDEITDIFNTVMETIEDVKNFISNAFEKIGQSFDIKETIDWFLGLIENIRTKLAEFYMNNKERIDEFLITIGIFIESAKEIIGAFINAVLFLLNIFGDDIINAFQLTFNTIINIFDFFTKLFKGDWNGAWDSLIKIFYDLFNGLDEWFENFWDSIKELFGVIGDKIKDSAKESFNKVVEGIKEPFIKFFDWIDGKFGWLGDTISKAGDGIKGAGEWIGDKAGDLFEGAKNLVGHADGTAYTTEGWKLINERGPELAYMSAGSQIYSNESLKKALGVDDKKTESYNISNNFNISSLVVREEADIKKISRELYDLQFSRNGGNGRR